MLVGRRDRNNALFLNVFLTGSSEKHTELNGSRTKKLAIAFSINANALLMLMELLRYVLLSYFAEVFAGTLSPGTALQFLV